MANTTVQLKKSGATGNVPSSLSFGELALNYADGKLYYKAANGTIASIQNGTPTNSFATVNANSSLILATSPTDTLSIVAGNNITISACTVSKTITINSPDIDQFARNTANTANTPAGSTTQVQFNDGGIRGASSSLTFDKTTGVLTAPIVASSNNGNGTNFKVGDDIWIGDVNIADTMRLTGQQNSANAYIVFGSSNNSQSLGRAGSGPLTYTGAFTATGIVSGSELTSTNSIGSEGGQVNLSIPASGTSLVGSVTIDVYGNQLRFFQGDSAKGAYIDLTAAAAGVGTNLLSGGSGSSIDQYARDTANLSIGIDVTQNTRLNSIETINTNQNTSISIIQGVDLTQNTNITTANNAAWAAFAKANAALANVSGAIFGGNLTITGNLTTGNIVGTLANTTIIANTYTTTFDTFGVITHTGNKPSTSNTTGALVVAGGVGVSGNVYADAIYDGGVEILTYFQGVDNTQNTRLNSIETINTNQNTSISIIQGVDNTQNTNITAVNNFAQSAYDTANLKFNTSGGNITGSVTITANNNLTVTGNLVVLGNTFSVGTQTLEVVDPMIILAIGNYTTDIVDIGFAGHYNNGTNAHTGFIRDSVTKDWYLFQGYTPELSGNNNVDINNASFDTANLIAKRVNANVVATTVTIGGRDQASVDSTQNTNISIIQGVDVTQNTRLNSIETINTNQNTSISIIQGVDLTQNTNITTANNAAWAAFAKANTALANVSGAIFGGALTVTGNLTISGTTSNGITFADGTRQITAASGSGGGSLEIINDNTSNNVYYINFSNNTSGTTNTISTSSNNLTFIPSTGTIGVKSVNITSNTNISANTVDLDPSLVQTTIDSFSTTSYRSAFYQVQLSGPAGIHILNLNIMYSGTVVYANTFGDVYSSIPLGTFSGSIVGSTLNVLFTPASGSITVAFIRNLIARVGTEGIFGSLGFIGEPVTIIYDAGLVIDPTTNTFDYGNVP